MKLTPEQIEKLQAPLPEWALKPHPIKSNMTVIHPMAVIDRLNEVFGIGEWKTEVEKESSSKEIQKTKNGERAVYIASCKLKLTIPEYDIHLEQFGGSTNDDEGDALKGSATDALTKIASYLGIGASIYKGQGNAPTGAKGLNVKEWATVRNTYQNTGKITPEEWEKCSPEQQKTIKEIKKGREAAKQQI